MIPWQDALYNYWMLCLSPSLDESLIISSFHLNKSSWAPRWAGCFHWKQRGLQFPYLQCGILAARVSRFTGILQGSSRHLHSVFRQFTLQHSRQGQRSRNPILPTRLGFLQRRKMWNHSGAFPITALGTIMSAPRELGQENWKFKFFLSFVPNLQSALATSDLLSEQNQKS